MPAFHIHRPWQPATGCGHNMQFCTHDFLSFVWIGSAAFGYDNNIEFTNDAIQIFEVKIVLITARQDVKTFINLNNDNMTSFAVD